MTTTSVLTPSAATTSWKAMQRVAALTFLIVALSVAAFSVGRASAHARHQSPAIAPSSISAPARSGAIDDGCRTGRAC